MTTANGAGKQQPQGGSSSQAAMFDAMHGALASQAHAVAREFGVDVVTVAFRPAAAGVGAEDAEAAERAVSHEFLGVSPEERMRRLIATDVSAMGPAELAKHAARLKALRAALVRKLQGTGKKEKQGVVIDGEVKVAERAPEH